MSKFMKSSGLLYQKVYDDIRGDIEKGVLAPGSKLPSEKQLSDKYDISRITIKTAFKLLVGEGLIIRTPGKGTFVTDDALDKINRRSEGSENKKTNKASSPPIIGVIFEHVSSSFGLDMMYHMDREAAEKGYKLCIRFSYTDQDREKEEIDFLMSLGVSGIIIMPSHGEHYNTKILRLVIDRFPVVLIDKNLEGIPVPAVYTDNDKCAGLLVDHLVDRGYKDIGLVTSKGSGISSITERKKGFYKRISDNGLKAHEECDVELKVDAICLEGNSIEEHNINIISEYLKNNPFIDSLVCLESGFLSDIYKACQRNGVMIPEDMAICSFDENDSAATGFFFTHVKQDESGIAKKSIELIDCLIRGESGGKIKDYKISGIFKKGKTSIVKK